MTTTGSIPSSSALLEASEESLNELFARDPESFSTLDVEKVVKELAAKRKAWQAVEAAGGKAPTKAALLKAEKAKVAALPLPILF